MPFFGWENDRSEYNWGGRREEAVHTICAACPIFKAPAMQPCGAGSGGAILHQLDPRLSIGIGMGRKIPQPHVPVMKAPRFPSHQRLRIIGI